MTNIKKYTYSEILSFFSPCDPPQYFQNACPIFMPESQEPILVSNFKPNPNFTSKPFDFVPKKARISDSSSESYQKSSLPSKVVDFRPQILKEDKYENALNNRSNNSANVENNANQSYKFRFNPESISKPISSSAPPTSTSDSKSNNTQLPSGNEILNFQPQKELKNQKTNNQEENKIEIQKEENEEYSKNNSPSNFMPQKEEKKAEFQKVKNDENNKSDGPSNFMPQKEEKKSEIQKAKNDENNKSDGPSNFIPQKEVKKSEIQKVKNDENIKSINTSTFNPQKAEVQEDNKNEATSKESKKTTPWANIKISPVKKNNDFEQSKSMQVQLQKEIDNSLISSTSNSSNDTIKTSSNMGFAPKKLDQTYEAPEIAIEKPSEKTSKSNQNKKTLTNFDEIEKEEKSQKKQKQNQPQQQKKSLFETLIEQEKQNQNNNVKKEIEKDEEEAQKKPNLPKSGFAPKPTAQIFEGPLIDDINKQNNSKNNINNKQEVKSGFSALMEQERISSEKAKKEKELQKEREKQNNEIKKPSIVDIVIAETMREKSKEKPKNYEEDIPEEKQSVQAFKPIKANESYEAPSIEEIESFSKKQQKKTTFSDALSSHNQNENKNKSSKTSFEELQKNESANQAKAKKQGSFSNAPSFFDLLIKEEKKEKEISQTTKNSNADKEEQKIQQNVTTGFNPKRNKPDAGSFSEMLNKEKQKQKESQSKNKTPTTVNVNVRSGTKFTGNYPSFAQLINDETRLEEQRSSPIPQISSTSLNSNNYSFQQKVNDEQIKADSSTIGDFVSVQGELPKKWINKKNRGRKRGGKGGNNRNEETPDLFWGTPNNYEDNDDDQNEQNWPSIEGQNENESSFGFEKQHASQKKDPRISWLSNVLEEELGEENPWEFAESLVNKSKPEMIRFLSTITFDQRQASNIATRFFQIYPAK